MNKKILAMGVGRSGTTALYNLLPEIQEDQHPNDIDYVYEHFLWDRETSNKFYKDVITEFQFVSALSIDRMHHYKTITLILNNTKTAPEQSESWIKANSTAKYGRRHYLEEIIKANGRLPFIKEVSPETNVLFINRNPVDAISSPLSMFSSFCNVTKYVTYWIYIALLKVTSENRCIDLGMVNKKQPLTYDIKS